MDTSTIQTMEGAAVALGSATKHIGAASLEIGKALAPAARTAIDGIPKSVNKTIEQARFGASAAERKHALLALGVGAGAIALLTVATVAHFVHKAQRSHVVREHKRQVAAALKRERAIDKTLSQAVAIRPASALVEGARDEDLAFANASGCFAILTYDPDVSADDPSAYRDVFVGMSSSMLEGVRTQLGGQGNLYVYVDIVYKRPVYVAFFPCDQDKAQDLRAQLVKVLGADESYNGVVSVPDAQ